MSSNDESKGNNEIGEILNGKHIEKAEEVFKGNKNLITSTKLRKLFILTSEMNKKSKPENNLNYLKMKMCYEIGRDNQVEGFNKKALLVDLLEEIIKRNENKKIDKEIKNFYEYMEALVAYEKFYSKRIMN